MNQQSWAAFQAALRARHEKHFIARKEDFELFKAYVTQMPAPERIPTLLHAYDRYRSLGVCGDPQHADQFETSCWSILISTILSNPLRPDRTEAIQILQESYHRCGHGSDVEPPVTLAEQAFQNQPYSTALFDAVHAYRETLRSSRSVRAADVKRKLNWILWHDPRHIEKLCPTRGIQQAIHSMDSQRSFQWQWLLRNTAAGLNSAPGKNWIKEGRKRLAPIGEEQFHSELDRWFQFPEGEVNLSATGSVMLRHLVWYGALVDPERALPVLVRLAHVSWSKRTPAGKVMGALAWVLRTHGGMRFEAEAQRICAKWASENAEVKRLETVYFPQQSEIRQKAHEESRQQASAFFSSRLQATIQALRAQYPDVFGPDGSMAPFFDLPEKTAVPTNKPPR